MIDFVFICIIIKLRYQLDYIVGIDRSPMDIN